jgi:DNA-binding transcriptional LysR family regulator
LDLPAIVAKTELLATVPESMLELLTDVAPIRVMPVPMVLGPLKETVYWHRRHENDPAHRWLRNLFKDCALTSAGADLDTTSPRGHAMGTHPLVTY